MASDSEKRNALDALLDDMHDWARERDPEVVRRRSDVIDVSSKLFIVGEAYAKDPVRKTGVSWIRRDYNIGRAGRLVPPTLLLLDRQVRVRCADGKLFVEGETQVIQRRQRLKEVAVEVGRLAGGVFGSPRNRQAVTNSGWSRPEIRNRK